MDKRGQRASKGLRGGQKRSEEVRGGQRGSEGVRGGQRGSGKGSEELEGVRGG